MADVDDNSTPQPPRICSQSKCRKVLDASYQFKSCEQCREHDKAAKQRKRQREKENKEARKRLKMTANLNGNCPEVIVIDAESSDDDELESNREVSIIKNLVIKILSTHFQLVHNPETRHIQR